SMVLGVIIESPEGPRVAYLSEPEPVTKRLLSLASGVQPTEVLRFIGRCEETACAHYDGSRCQLASRVVTLLPPVVDVLPPCRIRLECRWFQQEAAAACRRCPQISTYRPSPSETEVRVAMPSRTLATSSAEKVREQQDLSREDHPDGRPLL